MTQVMTMLEIVKPLVSLIEERCGISFKDGDCQQLIDALNKRLSVTGIGDAVSYYLELSRNHDEFSHFIELLTINETYFFREVEQINLFVNRIYPDLLARKGNERIKVVSLGCSNGSEIYSIAIKLLEKHGLPVLDNLSFFAADIDRNVLKKAKEGLYGKSAFRVMPEHIERKYFEEINGEFLLAPYLRNAVRFLPLNLLTEQYPAELHEADVIFYRNVSIYFEKENQKRIFNSLTKILNPDGYIIFSSTETHQHSRMGILPLCELDGMFLFRKKPFLQETETSFSWSKKEKVVLPEKKQEDISLHDIKERVRKRQQEANTPKLPHDDFGKTLDDALALAKKKEYKKALGILEKLLAKEPGMPDALTLKATILLNMGQEDEIANLIANVLTKDILNLEANLLAGIVRKNKSEFQEAVKSFRSAVYINPSSWFAHFNLGELHQKMGAHKDAMREYILTRNLVLKDGIGNSGLRFLFLSFNADSLVRLLEMRVRELSQQDVA